MNLRRTLLAGALVGTFLLFGSVPARAHNTCFDRIHREEQKLQRDISRHGYVSRQAQHRRQKLFRLRQQCGTGFFGWQDGRRGRWGNRDAWRWRDNRRQDWYWDGRRWRWR